MGFLLLNSLNFLNFVICIFKFSKFFKILFFDFLISLKFGADWVGFGFGLWVRGENKGCGRLVI